MSVHAPIQAHDTEDLPLQELFLGELGRLSYEKSLGQKQIEYDHIGRCGSVHHALSLPALKTMVYEAIYPDMMIFNDLALCSLISERVAAGL